MYSLLDVNSLNISMKVGLTEGFKAFNAELHTLSAQLRLCGNRITDVELIDKTLSTFPPTSVSKNAFFKACRIDVLSSFSGKQQQILLKSADFRPAREVHPIEALISAPSTSGPALAVVTPTLAPPTTPKVCKIEAMKRNGRTRRWLWQGSSARLWCC